MQTMNPKVNIKTFKHLYIYYTYIVIYIYIYVYSYANVAEFGENLFDQAAPDSRTNVSDDKMISKSASKKRSESHYLHIQIYLHSPNPDGISMLYWKCGIDGDRRIHCLFRVNS